MDSVTPILPLPVDAIAQIKSSIAITSLNGVAIELLKNSLDARSKKIEIVVDYCRGSCVVEDDGLGIPPLEFEESGGLGKLHHSSKYNGVAVSYGARGAFLASVAALSLLSITSHHHLHLSQNTLTINRSQVMARDVPAPQHQHIYSHKHGTRVAVRDLFGNMPVRVRQRIEESSRLSGSGREWEELRKLVTSVMLAWYSPVVFTVRDAVSGQKLHLRGTNASNPSRNIQSEAKLVAHVCNTLSQAIFISSPDQSKWVLASASTPRIRMRGALCREPAPTKAVQFLSIGIEPLHILYGHSVLYDAINRVFENSSFGNEEEPDGLDSSETNGRDENWQLKTDSFTAKQLRGSRKGFDRWPKFYIQIEFLDLVTQELELGGINDIAEDRKGCLSSVVELVQAMVLEFLKSHSFRPRISRPIHLSQLRESESVGNISGGGSRVGQRNLKGIQSRKQVYERRTGSPFNMWSRVKSGRPKRPARSLDQTCWPRNQVLDGGNKTAISLPNISNTIVCSSSSSDLNIPSLKNDTPTIARSGKVIRIPFGGLPPVTPKNVPVLLSSQNDPPGPDSSRQCDGEVFLSWVDPITKRESLVNSRTGLARHSSMTNRLMPQPSSYFTAEALGDFPISIPKTLTNDREPNGRSTTWIDKIVQNWNNPVYRPADAFIRQISIDSPGDESQQLFSGHRQSCSQSDIMRAFQEASAGLNGRISKEALRQANIISQVDSKFILIKIPASTVSPDVGDMSTPIEMLVIVDQHAADERIRIEELLQELCYGPPLEDVTAKNKPSKCGVPSALLRNPISFILPEREIQLLQMHKQHFENWGIIYDIPHAGPTSDKPQEYQVIVKSLPPSIIERCTSMPKLLANLLRSEVWKYSERGPIIDTVEIETEHTENPQKHPWLRRIHCCPQALVDMLNSRACRSSIMFNDVLSDEQSKDIISRLANCAFPFQCAHGRPSMIPLLSLDSFPWEIMSNETIDPRAETHFGAALKKWKSGMTGVTEHK